MSIHFCAYPVFEHIKQACIVMMRACLGFARRKTASSHLMDGFEGRDNDPIFYFLSITQAKKIEGSATGLLKVFQSLPSTLYPRQ